MHPIKKDSEESFIFLFVFFKPESLYRFVYNWADLSRILLDIHSNHLIFYPVRTYGDSILPNYFAKRCYAYLFSFNFTYDIEKVSVHLVVPLVCRFP